MRAPFDFGGCCCGRRRAAGLVGRWFRVLLMLRPTTERAGGRLVRRCGGGLVVIIDVVPLDLDEDDCCCCFFLVCCDLGGNFGRVVVVVVALEGEVERTLEDLNMEPFVLVVVGVVCCALPILDDDAVAFRFLLCEMLLVFMTTLNDRQCLVPPPCPSPVRFDRVLVRLSLAVEDDGSFWKQQQQLCALCAKKGGGLLHGAPAHLPAKKTETQKSVNGPTGGGTVSPKRGRS